MDYSINNIKKSILQMDNLHEEHLMDVGKAFKYLRCGTVLIF